MRLQGKYLGGILAGVIFLMFSLTSMAQAPRNNQKGVAVVQGLGQSPTKLVGKWAQAGNQQDDTLLCQGSDEYLGSEWDRKIVIKANRTFSAMGYEHEVNATFTRVDVINANEMAGQIRYVVYDDTLMDDEKPKTQKGYIHFKLNNDGRLQILKTIPEMDVMARGLLSCQTVRNQ